MNSISPVKFEALVNEAVEALPKRTKQVVVRRFGLRNGKNETLEGIGQDYNITRERVRQIEADGLRHMQRPEVLDKLSPAMRYLEEHFSEHGNLRGEEQVLQHLSGEDHPHPRRQAVFFVLTVGEPFTREAEDTDFYSHWFTKEEAQKKAQNLVSRVISRLEGASDKTVGEEELFRIARAQESLPPEVLRSYLDISKQISKNVFGEYGLAKWPEISPRGVRDKAYLVLKRAVKPLHFQTITDLINDAGFDARKAYVQTVHNELIKDSRFVLVGRGIYALSEWGYAAGTVRDVLADILREKGPMTRDEILAEVLKQRLVKPNTIILNLQNPQIFIRLGDGRYNVAK